MKFMASICIFLAVGNFMWADWNPAVLQSYENSMTLDILQDAKVKGLEEKIFSYLQGSWCSKEKARLIFELVILTRPKVAVEIGVFTGSSALPLLVGLQYAGQGKAYLVDSWSVQDAIQGLPPEDPNTIWWSGLDMQSVKNQFVHMLNSWSLNRYCRIVQTSSSYASYQFNDVDFLHLDGNFSEEGALLDSYLYLPKVKSGGYILISNLSMMLENRPTKTKALFPLFEACDIVAELEESNVLLFKKR